LEHLAKKLQHKKGKGKAIKKSAAAAAQQDAGDRDSEED
jgi:hypothetical protein